MFLIQHSKKAVFDNRKAVRGGIPIVFRKFDDFMFHAGISVQHTKIVS